MPAGDIGRITLAVSMVDELSAPLTRVEAMLHFVQRALDAAPDPVSSWRNASDFRWTATRRSASTLNAVAAAAKRAGGAVAPMFEHIVDHTSAMDATLHRMAGNLLPFRSAPAASLPMRNKLGEAAWASFGLLRASGRDVPTMSAPAKAVIAGAAEAAARATAPTHAVSATGLAGLGAGGPKIMQRLAGINVKYDHLQKVGSDGAAKLFRRTLPTSASHSFSSSIGAGSIGRGAASGDLISPGESDYAMGMRAGISRLVLAVGTITRASAVAQKALPLIRAVAGREVVGEVRDSQSSLDGNAEAALLMQAVVKGTPGKVMSMTSLVAPPTTGVAAMQLDRERLDPALLASVVRPVRPPYERSDLTNMLRKCSDFTLGTYPSDERTTTAAFSKLLSGLSARSQFRGFGERLRMPPMADAGRTRKHLSKGMAKLKGEFGFGIVELGGWKRNALFRAAREWPRAVTSVTPAQATAELPAVRQQFHTEGQTSSLSLSPVRPFFGLARTAALLRPIVDAFGTLVAIAPRARRGPVFHSIDGDATRGDGVKLSLLRAAKRLNLLQGPVSTHGSVHEAPVHVTVNAPLTVNGDIVEQAGLLTILDTWWREKEPAVVNAVERVRRQAEHTAARGSMTDAGDASSRLSGFAVALGLMP